MDIQSPKSADYTVKAKREKLTALASLVLALVLGLFGFIFYSSFDWAFGLILLAFLTFAFVTVPFFIRFIERKISKSGASGSDGMSKYYVPSSLDRDFIKTVENKFSDNSKDESRL